MLPIEIYFQNIVLCDENIINNTCWAIYINK